MNVNEIVGKYRLVPVIKIDSPSQAKPLAEALVKGGLPIAEVTFRTDAAADSIKEMHEAFPELCIGAGSLTTLDQCKEAYWGGASFFVSAGYSEKIADFADENSIPYFPGIATPTEIMRALSHDYKVLKFFPAEQLGGIPMIKAISAPFPGLKFMPTGGINKDNVAEYLKCDKVFAVGGSWMVPGKLMAEGKYDEIEKLIKDTMASISTI